MSSLDAAAKHLFRHLHEPRALRDNSLVRRFFEDPAIEGLGPARDRAILERIHDRIRAGADQCRDADLREGKDDRAIRRHAIVLQQCLGRRSIREVAAELGISFGYCYQERAEICRRIARFVADSDEAGALASPPRLDGFRVLADRVMRAGAADRAVARRECEELLAAAPSTEAKVEALRVSGTIALQFGDLHGAGAAYVAARRLFVTCLDAAPSPARETALAGAELLGSRLAYYRGDAARAIRMLERAVGALRCVQSNSPDNVRELYAETLAMLSATLWNDGQLERSYDCTVAADSHLSSVRTASQRLRVRIALQLWRTRNYLLMSSKSWFPSWKRTKGLTSVFEQAYAAGFFAEAISALVGLAECYLPAGNDAATRRVAQTALLLADKQPNVQLRAHTAIEVAGILLGARCENEKLPSLPAGEQLDACDAYHRDLVTSFLGVQRAFRMRDYAGALAGVRARGDQGDFTAVSLSRRIVAAEAAYELGRKRDAMALVEAVLPAAERLASVPVLRDAYDVAAKITGSPRLRRRAGEATQLLIA